MNNNQFGTGYMDPIVFNLADEIKRAQKVLAKVDFDTFVGTGFSGGILIPSLALATGKDFLLVRKEGDDSHHGGGKLVGTLGARWVFVDDFVGSGRTLRRVLEKIKSVEDGSYDYYNKPIDTTWVGSYLYKETNNKGRRKAWWPGVHAKSGL